MEGEGQGKPELIDDVTRQGPTGVAAADLSCPLGSQPFVTAVVTLSVGPSAAEVYSWQMHKHALPPGSTVHVLCCCTVAHTACEPCTLVATASTR